MTQDDCDSVAIQARQVIFSCSGLSTSCCVNVAIEIVL